MGSSRGRGHGDGENQMPFVTDEMMDLIRRTLADASIVMLPMEFINIPEVEREKARRMRIKIEEIMRAIK